MLGPTNRNLDEIAGAIADGRPVDWPTASDDSGDYNARVLSNLRIVAEIASLHASPSFLSSMTSGWLGTIDECHPATQLQPGSMWGHLKILERVGQGRFGVVYRAFDRTLDREVALKILRTREASTDSEIAHEGRMMARIHHPNVVTVFGAQVIGSEVGIWMQFVGGRSLEAELQQNGPFSTAEIGRVGVQLCEALTAVHSVGLLHRDVKSANVMRGPHDRIVLGDFGTGRLMSDASGMAGTPLYLAPEIIAGAPATPQSDIYSLGVLLFHIASGKYPVNARSLQDLGDAHRSRRRSALGALRPDLPAGLVGAIESAIAIDTELRWKTAGAFQSALDAARNSGVAVQPPASEPAARRRTAAFFIAAAGATVILVGSIAKVRQDAVSDVSAATPSFADVSTSSARARRSYETAVNLMVGPPPWPRAEIERLLRDALQADPGFASAHAVLSEILLGSRPQTGEFLDEALASVQSQRLSHIERTFNKANLLYMEARAAADIEVWRAKLQEATAILERVANQDPPHRFASYRLYDIYDQLHDDAGVLRVQLLAASRSPNGIAEQGFAAMEHARSGDFERSEPYLNRVKMLTAQDADLEYGFHIAWAALFPAQRAWIEGRPQDALKVLNQVAANQPPGAAGTDAMSRQLVMLALALGRHADAQVLVSEAKTAVNSMAVLNRDEQHDLQALLFAYRDDRAGLSALLKTHYATAKAAARRLVWQPIPNEIFAHQLRAIVAAARPGGAFDEAAQFARARLDLLGGDFNRAIATLREVMERRPERGISRLLWIALQLSDAYVGQGRLDQATTLLNNVTQQQAAISYGASAGSVWLMARARLADLYRQQGEDGKAKAIAEQLARLLEVADADHPLRGSLQSAR